MKLTETDLGPLSQHEWSILQEALNLHKMNLEKILSNVSTAPLTQGNLAMEKNFRWKRSVTQKLLERMQPKETVSVALSIRQPWAWLIVNGWKDFENRPQSFPEKNFRGRVLIHTGRTMTPEDYNAAAVFVSGISEQLGPEFRLPAAEELQLGGIVGETEIADWTETSESPWFANTGGFVLRNSKPLPFQPCKGALGFFTPVLG